MTEPTEHSEDRIAVVIDRGTRIVRLLTWTAMFVLVCLMLWLVSGMVAKADPGSGSGAGDPKAAARAIGNAGNAAARAVARDSSNAADVPGYAGTDLPERNIGASRLQDEGRARLGHPDDPGGVAGRAVVRGTTSRPPANVPASDPVVTRSEGIAASPQSPAHGADGIASGSATACGAELQDADDGGSCGSVRYCVGAGCETVSPQSNTGFVNATTRLNMAVELGGEEFDRDDMRFFTGQRRACHIKLFGLANCCKNSGLLVGLGNCSPEERELAEERNAGNTHYLGRYCSKRTLFGVCIRRSRAWCVFGSKLGRILQQQGRSQLGIGWGSCRGLTVAEVESIDFERLDLSEFTQDLMDGSREYDRQHGVTETWSQVSEASRRYSTQTGDSEMAGLDESLSANLTRMRTFQERASLARQESESWSEQAAQVRSDAQAIERELGQPFFAWLSEQPGTDGRALGAAGAMRIASPQTAEDSEQLREYAAAFIAEKYPAPAGPDPASVGGAAEYEGAAGELRGAYATETAAAYGGWSAGVRDRAVSAGAPRPGETGTAAMAERVESKTDMTMKGAAREARQTVTGQE